MENKRPSTANMANMSNTEAKIRVGEELGSCNKKLKMTNDIEKKLLIQNLDLATMAPLLGPAAEYVGGIGSPIPLASSSSSNCNSSSSAKSLNAGGKAKLRVKLPCRKTAKPKKPEVVQVSDGSVNDADAEKKGEVDAEAKSAITQDFDLNAFPPGWDHVNFV